MKLRNFLSNECGKSRRGHRLQVLAVPEPGSQSLGLDFLVADDQHVRNFLQLGFPNLEAELFITEILLDSQTSPPQLCDDLLPKGYLGIGDSKHNSLDRREPGAEEIGAETDDDGRQVEA